MTGVTGPEDAPSRRRGRPPRTESADTRDRILTAAREEFSERGYEKTSVRGIAKAAGVDSALVHQTGVYDRMRCFTGGQATPSSGVRCKRWAPPQFLTRTR